MDKKLEAILCDCARNFIVRDIVLKFSLRKFLVELKQRLRIFEILTLIFFLTLERLLLTSKIWKFMKVPKLWFLQLCGLFSTNFHFEEYFLIILASFSFFSISTTAAFTSQHQILSQDFHGSAIMKTKDNKNMKKSDYCVTPGCVKGWLISEDIFNLVLPLKKWFKSLTLNFLI